MQASDSISRKVTATEGVSIPYKRYQRHREVGSWTRLVTRVPG